MAVVLAIQQLALLWFTPLPCEYAMLRSSEPIALSACLVSVAVVVFFVVAREAVDPVRTYRRVALWALVVSFVPDVVLGYTSQPAPATSVWPIAVVFMVLHVVAWAVIVTLLTCRWPTSD
ncbi:MAG TPA: hypothetical protein VKE51_05300 [Vicinamibacterales bacterium]|nr:hypothetical protein [Vicinamibacterales bacterium]